MLRSRPKLLLILALAALLLAPSFSPDLRASSLETIQTKIAQYLKRPGVRSADWGIEIVDPTTNKVLLAVNPDKTFKPASVLKVVTTSAALEKLGPDFRFHTGVYTNGAVTPDGTIAEDLILVGHGDPNLVDTEGDLLQKPALQELAEMLQALGIKRVEGNVLGDDSYFDDTSHGKGWTAQDLRSIYGAPINALSINNNVFWIYAHPTKYMQLVSVGVEPYSSYFRIRNLGVTGSARSKQTMYARLIPGTKTIVVSGILPTGRSYAQHFNVDNPAAVTATTFKDELVRHGIAVKGKVDVVHNGDLPIELRRQWKLIADHESPPLIRALEIINKHSQNLHAEMLLRTLGAEFKGSGSDEAGLQVVKEFLLEAGVDNDKIQLDDGCGLSRENLVTPRFQTSLLQFLSTRPYFELFLNTLAVSGTDGTLRHRLASQQVRGSIHAKTGTLNGVSTLSGYMMTKSGRNLAFSIFANNVHTSMARVKRTIDEICSLFVNLY
ncbi:MAG TPA: D-alanyl-D-alanine carboxypeptidase/D-alanyl-D-alanine-endopeptidase [Acidobacteriota bacterium]|nr:D-alanyl-D-alanine carboxypeptidase/D-alanyl-D-alanine-endopeptidase [Acidobacteriota bacterium]